MLCMRGSNGYGQQQVYPGRYNPRPPHVKLPDEQKIRGRSKSDRAEPNPEPGKEFRNPGRQAVQEKGQGLR